MHISWNKLEKPRRGQKNRRCTQQSGNVRIKSNNNRKSKTNYSKLMKRKKINWVQVLLDIVKVLAGALVGQQLL